MRNIRKITATVLVAGSLASGGFAVGHVTAPTGVHGCMTADGTVLPTGDAARFDGGRVLVCSEDGTLVPVPAGR